MNKNVCVVAGTQDSGKTAFALNFVAMNMNRGMDIKYQTSEMGGKELVDRLIKFENIPLNDWASVDFRECATNFHDNILPNGINIIDYLEVTDSFWMVGDMVKKIFDKLDKGICLIAMQKDFKAELGRGGTFGLEKPRLYVTMTSNPPEGGIAKIIKCKNWKNSGINPNGRSCNFKIRHASQISQVTDWEYSNAK